MPCIIWQRLDQYLFGKDWLQRLINIHAVSSQGVPTKLQILLEKYAETVFKPGLGKLEGITASLTLKPDVNPKFCKSRPVPYALQPKVEETLEKWQKRVMSKR